MSEAFANELTAPDASQKPSGLIDVKEMDSKLSAKYYGEPLCLHHTSISSNQQQ